MYFPSLKAPLPLLERWCHGRKEGKGALQTYDGTTYDGEWKEGAMHGEGTYAYQVSATD